ncbi:hypothetical protein KJA17_00790 [Patescibacteria group bacterium]|nr:hypothetical protein [Patescibacteria group bacterium]
MKISSKGSLLIIAILVLGILLFLASYFISFSLTGSQMSRSKTVSTKAYYLAEAGIAEAIWKLKNDEITTDGDTPWKICFVTSTDDCLGCSNWQDSFTRNYDDNSTTTISIQNSRCAKGEIIATSTVLLSKGRTAQRVIKIKVLKALGSLTENSPIFSGAPSGESTIQASKINVYNGNIFSNNNINIKYWSTVNVYDNPTTPTSTDQEGQVLAVQNINVSLSTLNASSTCAKNCCTQGICEKCPPDSIEMPAIDFDSDNPNSYKSKAEKAQEEGQCQVVGKNSGGTTVFSLNKCLFDEDEFEELLWQVGKKGTLILEHKTSGLAISTYYIEGGIDLKGERYLEINGILVADETINIGEKFKWGEDYGFSQLKIADPGDGIPSGLLTKGKMNFGPYSSFGDVEVRGLIYSQDEMRLTSLPHSFEVFGGIIARKISLSSAFSPINIYLDNAIIREGVWGGPQPPGEGALPYSPVVTIEHWEESY